MNALKTTSLGLALTLVAATSQAAVVMYGDEAGWKTAVDYYQGTAEPDGAVEGAAVTSITGLSGGSTLSDFSTGTLTTAVVPTSWATWPGQPGSDGTVVYISGADTLTMQFTPGVVLSFPNFYPVNAFGFYVEPNVFSEFAVTLALETGDFVTQLVQGSAGAKFFGWTGLGVTGLSITCEGGCQGFAFGDFYEGHVRGVPEPGSLALLGLGLVGLGLRRRRIAA